MTKFKYTIEIAKVVIAYTCILLTVLTPVGVSVWAGFQIGEHSGNHFMGAMSATALSLPGLFLGLALSRIVAFIFLSTWGKNYER